jgi:hypothetical protein
VEKVEACASPTMAVVAAAGDAAAGGGEGEVHVAPLTSGDGVGDERGG